MWTVLEWHEQHPWREMTKSPLRDQFKTEAFMLLYSYGAGSDLET